MKRHVPKDKQHRQTDHWQVTVHHSFKFFVKHYQPIKFKLDAILHGRRTIGRSWHALRKRPIRHVKSGHVFVFNLFKKRHVFCSLFRGSISLICVRAKWSSKAVKHSGTYRVTLKKGQKPKQ